MVGAAALHDAATAMAGVLSRCAALRNRTARLPGARAFATAPQLPALVVHGGAWAIPEEKTEATLAGIREATLAGWAVLHSGGSSVDAVEAAVRVLEDDPVFDAGRGSVLTEEGKVEMDAVIMDGANLASGAVACITRARNPISVARAVMEQTEHCLVVGAGADNLVEKLGCEAAAEGYLTTEAAQTEYEHFKSYSKTVDTLFRAQGTGHDTVGAVAVDLAGNVASATSTGGITFGMPGRVGDSPLVGLGCLADNDLGALSATGHGESIMRMCLGSRIMLAADGRGGQPALEGAVAEGLAAMRQRVGGHGGIIAVLPDGSIAVDFSTERMAWGLACGRDPYSGESEAAEGGGTMRVGIDRKPGT
jgi:beta-aspartyl-peptidase (threonine type)